MRFGSERRVELWTGTGRVVPVPVPWLRLRLPRVEEEEEVMGVGRVDRDRREDVGELGTGGALDADA